MKCNHDLTEQEVACYADGLCPICLKQSLEKLKKEKLVRVIHHPKQPRTSTNLYGTKAWDEYVYE